jgi:hypothetical protein
MDKKTVVIIAITALITAIAKEFVSAIFSVAKSTATSDTTKKKFKSVFSKTNLRIIRDALGFIIFAVLLERELRSKETLTRWAVLDIVFYFWSTSVCLLMLLWDFELRKLEKLRSQTKT